MVTQSLGKSRGPKSVLCAWQKSSSTVPVCTAKAKCGSDQFSVLRSMPIAFRTREHGSSTSILNRPCSTRQTWHRRLDGWQGPTVLSVCFMFIELNRLATPQVQSVPS
jgi:hypothetical protein